MLTGKFSTICEDCGIAKVRQKDISKEESEQACKLDERLFLDIVSVKMKSYHAGYKF